MTARIKRDAAGNPVHHTELNAGDEYWECLCGFETVVGAAAAEHDKLGLIRTEPDPTTLEALREQLADVVVKAQDEGHQAGMTFAILQMKDRAALLVAEQTKIDPVADHPAWLAVGAAARALKDLATDLEGGL